MAIIEPQKEPRNILVPLVASAILLLVLAGIGYGIYTFIGGPSTRQIKLTGEDAKKALAGGNNNVAPMRAGPPFPTMPPLQQETDPGATLITLDLKNASLSEVVDAISKQAGVKVNAQQNGGMIANLLPQRFDFSATNSPFWTVIQDLCKARGMYPAPYNYYQREAQITLVSGASPNAGCPVVSTGSSKLLLTGITSRFNAELLGSRPANRQLSVAMLLYVDPKVDPFRISPALFIETATDENGVSLVRPRDPWQDQNNGGPRNKYIASLQGQLQFPANAGQRIAHLKGYASIATAGAPETVKVKDPLQAVNLDTKVGGQTIRLQRMQKQGSNNYEAQFEADFTSPAFKDWNNVTKFSTLRDANGREYNTNTYVNSIGGKTIGLTAQYSGDANLSAPVELDLTLPTEFKELRVPFEFTDLPLPH